MENFTFKYKNGKYILKESYGTLEEAGPGDIDPSADADYKVPDFAVAKEPEIKTPDFLSGDDKPEVKNDKKANSAFISGFLINLGFSKEEIETIYEKVKVWGKKLAGPGTLIIFDDVALKRELDISTPSADSKGKKEPTVMSEIEKIINQIESIVNKKKDTNEKVAYLEQTLKSAQNDYATSENPSEKDKKILQGIEQYIKVTIEKIQNAGISSSKPSSNAQGQTKTPATHAEISESYVKIRMPKNNKKHPSLVGWRAR